MMSSENVENFIKRMRIKAGAHMHERTLNDALKAHEESRKTKSAKLEPNIWRTIMRSPITKLSSAAVIVIAVILGILSFVPSGNGTNNLWAKAVQTVKQTDSAIWRARRIFTCDGKEISFLNTDAVW